MDTIQIINLTPNNIADYGVCGYKDVQKHKKLRNKILWFNSYYPKGFENIMAKLVQPSSEAISP